MKKPTLALSLALTLAACGGGTSNTTDGGSDAVAESSSGDALLTDASGSDGATPDTASSDAALDAASPEASLDAAATDTSAADTSTRDTATADTNTADTSAADVATDTQLVSDGATCIGRPASCVAGTPGGLCGDAIVAPNCVSGSWMCPAGTIPITQCACTGRPPGASCTCAPTGWSCPDAGGSRSFACGTAMTCNGATQYCNTVVGGPAGSLPRYTCTDFPSTCAAHNCTCFASGGTLCSTDTQGNVTVTLLAP